MVQSYISSYSLFLSHLLYTKATATTLDQLKYTCPSIALFSWEQDVTLDETRG
jgi:hypothetical protein